MSVSQAFEMDSSEVNNFTASTVGGLPEYWLDAFLIGRPRKATAGWSSNSGCMTSFEMDSGGLRARLSWKSVFHVSRGPGLISKTDRKKARCGTWDQGAWGGRERGVPRESYVVSYRFTERPCLRKTRWAARLREGDFWGASPKFGVWASHANPREPTGTLTETSCFSHYWYCYLRANTACLRAWNDPESLGSHLVWLYRFCVTRWFWKCVAPGHMPWKIQYRTPDSQCNSSNYLWIFISCVNLNAFFLRTWHFQD